ncbi:hypothetical protein K1719_013368 [Acacia pycnantha]|nr:hypothetical protein K1719_013368 [Acacia pycnantha]
MVCLFLLMDDFKKDSAGIHQNLAKKEACKVTLEVKDATSEVIRAVHFGTAALKDATSEAIRDWVTNMETTHYILGSVSGPHPYPMMVREFHAVIGEETRRQALEKWGGKPDVLVACVGGVATLTKGEVGVLHGAMSYLLQDDDGQNIEPHCISAGLD